MDEKDIREKLIIEEGNLIKTRKSRYIEIDVFLNRFKESVLTYESLVENENTNDGWKSIFDEWKQKGILS